MMAEKSQYPSVTTVLDVYVETQFFTKEAAERGDIVHAATANYLLGNYVAPLDIEYSGYYDSAKRYIDRYVEEIITVEVRLEDEKNRYNGKADLGCRIKGRPHAGILDWKTGQAVMKTWGGQVSAYLNLAKINIPSFNWAWAASVRLDPLGKMPKLDFVSNPKIEFQYFLNALAAYRRYK